MSRQDDDAKYKLFTEAKWDGSRTPAFRKFKRDLHVGADAMFLTDDDYSILSAWLDNDQGGLGPNADALPAQGQNGFANAVRRRRKRQARAFEILYRHIEDDRLKELLAALPRDDRRGVNAYNLLVTECDETCD